MRFGIDAMGGDYAPAEQIAGALEARDVIDPDDRIVLIGDEALIRSHLDSADGWETFIDIHHAEQVIGMDEAPVEALRVKPRSSIAVMAEMHRAREIDACISAGNTGACVAAAQMRLRRLRGVHRPGIAVVTPTPNGPVALCDVGANVNCRPTHLQQYGLMASLYIQAVGGIDQPRVGLLSVGEEDAKGNELVKLTRERMKDDPRLHFIGNVEGRDVFSGVCDVMVCEGFVGNVVLKLMEGMAEGLVRSMLTELASVVPGGEASIRQAAHSLRTKYDFNEYGGAPLLGVDGICMICHGATKRNGIRNGVRGAKLFSTQRVNEQITDMLAHSKKDA